MQDAPDQRQSWLLAILAAALALYPPALGWAVEGVGSAFRFFAADAFYYLTVAKHDLPFPLYAFDGIHPTNGFHPLWQAFLNAAFQNIGALRADQAAQIGFAHWVGAGCVALAAAALAVSAARLTRSPALALFCVLPGFLYLPAAMVAPARGNIWSYANGMETPFSLLIFAALLTVLLRGDFYGRLETGRTLAVSALAALLVLARLDDVFMLAALSLPVLAARRPAGEALRGLILLNAIPAAAILAYMAVNAVYVGDALPVSGRAKSGFALIYNLRQVVNLGLPVDVALGAGWEAWANMAGRALFVAAPPAVAALFLAWRGRPASAGGRVMAALAVYVILKGLYNLCFVQIWHQGHWYFPLSFVIASIQIAMMIAPEAGRVRAFRRGGAEALSAAAALFAANAVAAAAAADASQARMHGFWTQRAEVMRDLAAIDPEMRILSYDDGVVGYVLDVPVMSAFGFALDHEAAEAAREGRLLDVAYARGFRYIGSVNSLPLFDLPPGTDVTEELAGTGWFSRARPGAWRFEIAHMDPKTELKLFRFRPAADR